AGFRRGPDAVHTRRQQDRTGNRTSRVSSTLMTGPRTGLRYICHHITSRQSPARPRDAARQGRKRRAGRPGSHRYILMDITKACSEPMMQIDTQALTTCEVAADGAVSLGFVDSDGNPATLRLSLNQVGTLVMTLPGLLDKALQRRFGDG